MSSNLGRLRRGIIPAMTTKERARQVIQALPDEATMEDIMYALYLEAKAERGEQEIRQGRGIPHHEARKRLAKWQM